MIRINRSNWDHYNDQNWDIEDNKTDDKSPEVLILGSKVNETPTRLKSDDEFGHIDVTVIFPLKEWNHRIAGTVRCVYFFDILVLICYNKCVIKHL